MADRSEYLQEMVNLVGRLVEGGFREGEIQEMFSAASPREVPYTRGTRTEYDTIHVA